VSAPEPLGLCFACKHLCEVVSTDELGRSFCATCVVGQPAGRVMAAAAWVAFTIPYRVGDKVSCKTGGQIYDGIGHVEEVSIDPKDLASPVVPMFRVAIDEKAYEECPDEVWYSSVCLSLVDA
jgi:hypothetical protein